MTTFRTQDRVSLSDTDASGLIHFMYAMRYFEIGEREAMRAIGVKVGDVTRGGFHLPRVHVSCDFHRPLFYDDEIQILSTCMAVKNSSITWEIRVLKENELCLSGQMVTVFVDTVTLKPAPVPEAWRQALL